jgi:hypothetical protein
MPKLTKRLIEAVEPENKDVIIRDTELKGFLCKVPPKGKRVYMLYYRTALGQKRKPVIGVHGSITCEQARDIAQRWKSEIALGNDPSGNRQAAKQSLIMTELAERYMQEYAPQKKPRSREEDQRLWSLHILPRIGKKKANTLTRADISCLHQANLPSSFRATPDTIKH